MPRDDEPTAAGLAESAFHVLSSRGPGSAEPRAPDPLCHLRAGRLSFLSCQRAGHTVTCTSQCSED